MSSIIKTLLEDLGDDASKEPIIPLPNITGVILRLVLDWAEHHHEAKDLPPEDTVEAYQARAGQPMSPWDEEYFTKNGAVLGDIFMATNQLDIKGLVFLIIINKFEALLAQLLERAGQAFVDYLSRMVGGDLAPSPQDADDGDENETDEDPDKKDDNDDDGDDDKKAPSQNPAEDKKGAHGSDGNKGEGDCKSSSSSQDPPDDN